MWLEDDLNSSSLTPMNHSTLGGFEAGLLTVTSPQDSVVEALGKKILQPNVPATTSDSE